MLGVSWIELFLRGIPEMLLMIWGIHVIARKSFDIKKCVSLSIIMSIVIFFIRKLPIYFGIHTIIMIILIIGIMVAVGIPIITSIYGTLFMSLLFSLSEFLNMLLLKLFYTNINVNSMSSIKKSLFGIPSLMILFLFILVIRCLIKKEKNQKCI